MNTKWILPPHGFYNLNFNGAARHSQGLAAAGVIPKLYSGELVAGCTGNLNGYTSNQAEGMALA